METDGPIETMVLENGLADPDGDGPLPAVAAGSTVTGRSITTKAYDEGKPDGAAYHLETTETKFGRIDGYPDADQQHKIRLRPARRRSLRLNTRQPNADCDAGSGGANLTANIVFDASGRTLKTWGVDSTTTEPAESSPTTRRVPTRTTRRAATARVGRRRLPDQGGGHHHRWRLRPEPGALSERRSPLGRFGDGGLHRDGGRQDPDDHDDVRRRGPTVTVQVTSDKGAALPAETTSYDPATGQAVSTTSAAGTTLTRTYDQLGRSSYTDAERARLCISTTDRQPGRGRSTPTGSTLPTPTIAPSTRAA